VRAFFLVCAVLVFAGGGALGAQDALFFIQRAKEYTAQFNADKALENYDAALGVEAGNVRALNGRGAVFLQKKEYAKARMDFEKAYNIDPEDAETRHNLQYIYDFYRKNPNLMNAKAPEPAPEPDPAPFKGGEASASAGLASAEALSLAAPAGDLVSPAPGADPYAGAAYLPPNQAYAVPQTTGAQAYLPPSQAYAVPQMPGAQAYLPPSQAYAVPAAPGAQAYLPPGQAYAVPAAPGAQAGADATGGTTGRATGAAAQAEPVVRKTAYPEVQLPEVRKDPYAAVPVQGAVAPASVPPGSASVRMSAAMAAGAGPQSAAGIPEDAYQAAVAVNNAGVLLNRSGDFAKAIVQFTNAISGHPGFAIAYNNRGAAYFYSGEYERALADFNKALSLNPFYYDAQANREQVKITLASR
jgi:tetratricopeptide (TPR) repeat protein